MAEVEIEIEVGIWKFIKFMKEEKGIDIESMISINDVKLCMEQIHVSRIFNLKLDLFLHMCDFLTRAEIIRITILSKKIMDDYYKHIWGYLQSIYYTKSIIPFDDYIDIRHAISLDNYYFYLLLNNTKPNRLSFSNESFAEFNDLYLDEHNFKMINKHVEVGLFDNINSILKDFLIKFRLNSISDDSGMKYYTLKPEIDCRLYGLDPIDDSVKTEIKRKWVTGEYNAYRITSLTENEHANEYRDPEFIYERDFLGLYGYSLYKYRIRPDYC